MPSPFYRYALLVALPWVALVATRPIRADDTVTAHAYEITKRLDITEFQTFATLDAEEHTALRSLQFGSAIYCKIYAFADSVLIVPGPKQPTSGLKFLLSDTHNRLFVMQNNRWIASLSRSRFFDLLDARSATSSRQITKQEIEESLSTTPTSPSSSSSIFRTKEFLLNQSIAYRPQHHRTAKWPIGITYRFIVRDRFVDPTFTDVRTLYAMAMPVLSSDDGYAMIETIGERFDAPINWQSTIKNEHFHSQRTTTWIFHLADEGWSPVAARDIAVVQERIRKFWNESDIAPAQQDVAKEKLSHIRKGPLGGDLTISNRSSFAALIYVDGALIGWVAPEKEFRFKGLNRGFYRIFATSPSGIHYWPARDTHLPAEITLP